MRRMLASSVPVPVLVLLTVALGELKNIQKEMVEEMIDREKIFSC
jgi:hypothetical protein